jgi:uncharacterized protein YkwD
MLAALRRRIGRLVFGALVTTTVVALVLAIPVISGVGGGSPAVQLDSSSTSAAARSGESPVVMGLDGRPVPSGDAPDESTPGGPSSAPPTPAEAPSDPVSEDSAAPVGSPASSAAPGTTAAGSPSSSVPPSVPARPARTTGSTPTTGTTEPTESDDDSAPPPAAPAVPVSPVDPVSEVLALVNEERAAAGCGALVADDGLAATALEHSDAMSSRGEPDLDDLDLPEIDGAAAVAHGPADAASVVAGWLADPADSATLLDCSRTAVGIAVADTWWTALLT